MRKGMRYRSWLRHYVTSRKGTGSIPEEVTRFVNFFQPHNGPGANSASNRNGHHQFPGGGEGRPARKAENLTAICEWNV
jgi:hypothetical protein